MSRWIDADALEEKAKQYSLGYYEADEWAVPLCEISEAPSIDIEPKRGEWIFNGNFCGLNHHKCSKCGKNEFRMSNFCPNCGADMREREGE